MNGRTRIVELLLAAHVQKWPEITISDNSSQLLFWTAYMGHDAAIRVLIAAGIVIDKDLPPDRLTTLQGAVMNNNTTTVNLLLNSDIDVSINAKDKFG